MILAIWAPILGACSADSTPPDAASDSAQPDTSSPLGTVEIGTGTVGFIPLEDGGNLILWAGVQGGHHFIVHARIQDMDPGTWQEPGLPENPRTLFSAFDESGRQVDYLLPPYALGYRDEDDGWFHFPSGRFLRIDDAVVDELFDARVRLRIEVEDAAGVTAVDERWVHVVREPQRVDAGVPDASPGDASLHSQHR